MNKKQRHRESFRLSSVTPFVHAVLRVVARIPKGTVRTYAWVAKSAGYPNAARAVGTLMRKNYDPDIPCHRVIKSDGGMGGYNRGGEVVKRRLLQKEGALLPHKTRTVVHWGDKSRLE